MATFYTKNEARSLGSKTLRKSSATDNQRVLRRAVDAATDRDRYDIFLSPASKDAELILGVKTLMEDMGLSVYVDWIDDSQLDHVSVSRENADVLRRRMRQSSSLIWVATDAASASKWMPWELGYFDGFRPNQVAILPLVDSSSDTFKGQEYLALYPVVDKDNYTDGRADVFVEDRWRQWTTLKSFGGGQRRLEQIQGLSQDGCDRLPARSSATKSNSESVPTSCPGNVWSRPSQPMSAVRMLGCLRVRARPSGDREQGYHRVR